MKKIIEGLVMVSVGLLIMEVVKQTIVFPAKEVLGEGLAEIRNKK